MILLVRACRRRKGRQQERSSDVEEGRGEDSAFGHQQPSGDRKFQMATIARRTFNKILEALHWKDLKSIRNKFRFPSSEKGAPSASRAGTRVGAGNQLHGDGSSRVALNTSRNSRLSQALQEHPRRVQMAEVGSGSIRKLEHLTGSIVVPIPQPTTEDTNSQANPPQSSRSYVTDGGITQPSTAISSTDTYSRRHYSIGDIIQPLTAPPPNPRHIAGVKPKRVSFGHDNRSSHHAAIPVNSGQRRMTFPQQRVFNHPLPPSPTPTPSPPVIVHGGNDKPRSSLGKQRSQPPLPLLIVQSGSSGNRGGRRTERSKRHSWSGRSVLDLGDSSPGSADSPPHHVIQTVKPSYRHRKPVPLPKRMHAALPHQLSSTAPRLPLQELSRTGYAHHSAQPRLPRLEFAPRIDSMIGETIEILNSQAGAPLSPPYPQSDVDSPSTVSSGKNFRDSYSPKFQGLSPPPSRSMTGTTSTQSHSPSQGSQAMASESPQGRPSRLSVGPLSPTDTVNTEGTADTLGTNLTEKELIMEMANIRERAKRASIERKARRLEEEKMEMEQREEEWWRNRLG